MGTTCPDLDVAGHEGISANNIHLHHCSLSLRYHDSMWHDISGNRSTQKQSFVTIKSSWSVTFSEYANHENDKNLFVPVHCSPLQSSFHRLDSSPIVTWHVIRGEVLDDHQNGSGNTCKETQRSTPQILPHPNKPISIRKSGAHANICQCYCPTFFFIDSNFKSAVQVTSMGVERHRFQRNVSRSSRIPRFVLPKGLELPGSHGDQHSCWRRAKAAIWWSDYVFRIFGFWSGSNKTDRLHNLWARMWYYVVL